MRVKSHTFICSGVKKMTETEILSFICSASPAAAIVIVWVKMSARIDILNARLSDMSERLKALERVLNKV